MFDVIGGKGMDRLQINSRTNAGIGNALVILSLKIQTMQSNKTYTITKYNLNMPAYDSMNHCACLETSNASQLREV